MHLTINAGHTPAAQGACGILNEVTEDRKVKNALIAELRARGHQVSDCTADDWMGSTQDLNTQTARANASGASLGVSIHFNAFNGSACGTEVLFHPASAGGDGERYARDISANLAGLMGITNRGAKQRGDLWWLNGTNMTAVLVEVCFVDSQSDANAYCRVGAEAVARSIADAIVGGSSGGSTPPPAPAPAPTPSPSGGHHVWLQAKNCNGYVLEAVKDNADNAGDGSAMTYLSAWTTPGTLDVQARTQASGWLSKLNNPSNINDTESGSVGDGSAMTGLKMYYWSPNGDMAVFYRVMVGGVWLPWMKDDKDLGGSSDDFAGNGGVIQRVEAYIGRA